MTPVKWSVRVRAASTSRTAIPIKGSALEVGRALSFDPKEPLPTALELALSAYAADVLNSFQRLAATRRLPLDQAECAVHAELENPLAHLGVIGEEGSPRIQNLTLTLFAALEAAEDVAQELFETALARSPLHQTLRRAAEVQTRLVIT